MAGAGVAGGARAWGEVGVEAVAIAEDPAVEVASTHLSKAPVVVGLRRLPLVATRRKSEVKPNSRAGIEKGVKQTNDI